MSWPSIKGRRGAAPGERRGGRAKGTPNKNALPLVQKAKDLGVDPFEVLLLFAKGDWKALGYKHETMTVGFCKETTEEIWDYTIRPDVRARAASMACEYLYPKRKALAEEVEVKDAGIKIVLENYSSKE